MFIEIIKRLSIFFFISSIAFANCLECSHPNNQCFVCKDLLNLIEKQQIIIQYKMNSPNEELLKKLIEIYKKHLEEAHGKKLQEL